MKLFLFCKKTVCLESISIRTTNIKPFYYCLVKYFVTNAEACIIMSLRESILEEFNFCG